MPKIVDADERRATLALVAARLIAESGLEKVKLRDIAAQAGCSTGTLTHYFPDKRRLLFAALTTSLEAIRGRDEDLTGAPDELERRIERALPVDEERLQHWRVTLAFKAESWADPELTALHQDLFRRWRAVLAVLLDEGLRTGRYVSDLDAESLADDIAALVHGVALQVLFDPERWPPSKQRAFIARHLQCLTPEDY